ncbi:hypothetical protein AVEN_182094-1 [Araneus ventricosus]|uniref:Reverse transcriptase domain-containing protein n=1 Tax=Araneus ventricosus TaxID=182803 RepID=A0A4Y2KYG9_ARAVE|nr:hypothetical protein AVEN_182094-1 [Araneus ventricosus]
MSAQSRGFESCHRNLVESCQRHLFELSQRPLVVNAGVVQVSKIGPTLFALYIKDIPKQFNTLLCVYSDDTAILARNKNPKYTQIALNRHLKALEDWFIKWKIEINVSKTEAIKFANALSYSSIPPIKVNDKIIP